VSNAYDGIRALLAGSPAWRISQNADVWDLNTGPWWKLFTDHEGLDRAKRGLLAAAWGLPGPLYFVPPFEPLAPELGPFLQRTDSGAWMVNRQRSPEEFYGVELNEGNWVLYSAEQPVRGKIPNTFKTKPEALTAFMRQHGITFLIDAFYDDTEWRVALAES